MSEESEADGTASRSRYEYRLVMTVIGDQGSHDLTDLGLQGWRVSHMIPRIDNPGLVHVLLERPLAPGAVRS